MSLVAHQSELMSGGKLPPYDGVRMVDREGVGGGGYSHMTLTEMIFIITKSRDFS